MGPERTPDPANWDWNGLHTIALHETRRILRDQHEAEDAAQEAIVRAYRAQHTCRTPQTPAPWIRVIARREAFRRHSQSRDELTLDEHLEPSRDDPHEQTVNRVLAMQLLRHATPTERELLIRRYVLDQTSNQIADALAVPSTTVRVQLHRITNRIRDMHQPSDT